jgi:hypothetical protein
MVTDYCCCPNTFVAFRKEWVLAEMLCEKMKDGLAVRLWTENVVRMRRRSFSLFPSPFIMLIIVSERYSPSKFFATRDFREMPWLDLGEFLARNTHSLLT